MIEIYPSKLAGGPLETHATTERMTLEAWLRAKVPSFESRESPPISISVNGCTVPPVCWGGFRFRPEDSVAIYLEPKGADLVIAAVTLKAALKFVTSILVPKMPSLPKQNSLQGEKLAEATAKGNQIKINSPIREIAGRRKIYPDYLLPLRRYFQAGEPRAQWAEMLLCIGKGKYQINASEVQVGDTPIISLGDDAEYAVYQPGADLSGEPAAIWWHSATEVGSTSSGTAGLELRATYEVDPTPDTTAYLFSGDTLTIPAGAGAYPDGWETGMIVRIEVQYTYTVTGGGADQNVIEGPLEQLAPFPGMILEIVGASAGYYVVDTYSPYTPGTAGDPGSPASITGSSPPARYNYSMIPATVTVSWGAATYAVSLNTNLVDLSGLLGAFNDVLSGSGIVAAESSGLVQLVESSSSYTGDTLSISGDTLDIFGSSPITVPGEETVAGTPEQPARMTLVHLEGQDVTSLQTGTVSMGIGYAGLRYRITAASTTAISVERLTNTGAPDPEEWPGFAELSSTTAVLNLDASTQQGDWSGPFAACPVGETTTQVEWDAFFPGGLIRISSKGNLKTYSVTVELQYRDIATAGAWNSTTKTYSAKTMDQLGFTEALTLPYAMRPEVRMRRIGAKSTDPNTQDTVQWYGLRAKLSGPTSYAGVTTLALRVRGGQRLASQSEQLVSVIATRMLPVHSGGIWSAEVPTRGIAPWVAYVAHSIGYTDDDLDLDELDRLDAIWSARGDYFDAAVDATGTVKESINDALLAGFAELTIDRGKIRPVRDEPRTTFEHLYTPQNMIEGLSRQFSAIQPDDYDGVDVEYVDGITWQKETVECRLPGDVGRRVEKLKLEGVTSRARAWRIGMRQRSAQRRRRWRYSWSTEMDALNSGYLSYCAVGDDVPGYGQSALLLSYALVSGGHLLESSEPVDWSAGGTHVVALRRPDGTLSGPYTATRVDDYRLTIPTLDFAPDTSWSIEPPHLLFGPLNRWSYPVLITGISPSGESGAQVEAMNYDPRVYEYDDSSPPA